MTSGCLVLLGKWVGYLSLRVDGSRSFDEFSGLYIAPCAWSFIELALRYISSVQRLLELLDLKGNIEENMY